MNYLFLILNEFNIDYIHKVLQSEEYSIKAKVL